MLWGITQAAWFLAAATIFFVDSQYRKRKNAQEIDPMKVDLGDKSVMPWVLISVVIGGLSLPIYCWITRRTVVSIFIGIGLAIACGLVASVVRLLAVHLLFGGYASYDLG